MCLIRSDLEFTHPPAYTFTHSSTTTTVLTLHPYTYARSTPRHTARLRSPVSLVPSLCPHTLSTPAHPPTPTQKGSRTAASSGNARHEHSTPTPRDLRYCFGQHPLFDWSSIRRRRLSLKRGKLGYALSQGRRRDCLDNDCCCCEVEGLDTNRHACDTHSKAFWTGKRAQSYSAGLR